MSDLQNDRIEGWKGIASYVRAHVNTVQRWARRNMDPLPVREGHLGVYSLKSALDAWMHRQDRPLQAADEIRTLRAVVKDLEVRAGGSITKRPGKQPRETSAKV